MVFIPMEMTTPKKRYRCQIVSIRLAARSPKNNKQPPKGKSFRGPKRSTSVPLTGEKIAWDIMPREKAPAVSARPHAYSPKIAM